MLKTILGVLVLSGTAVYAHCDSLDGPVVVAARRALSSGNVNLVLPWIPPGQESTIRQAFARTLAVRSLNADAAQLADTWFFETLVRIHRTGEGAPYDGLKPAGTPVARALIDADTAIAKGDLNALEKTLTSAVQEGLRQRFAHVLELKDYEPANVTAGRKYVAAYVDFIHFAERLDQAVAAGEQGEHSH